MSSEFRLFRVASPDSADERAESAFPAGLGEHAPDGREHAPDNTADDLAGLPPDLAALAAQLSGQAQQLEQAYPAGALNPMAAAEASTELLQGAHAGQSGLHSGHAPRRWSRSSQFRRWSSAAAAAALLLGLSLGVRRSTDLQQPLAPPATAGFAEPAPSAQPTEVHAVIFSELSGAEQEGLLDLLNESGSFGSI